LHRWGEIWHGGGPLFRAKFHPHRCDDKGIGPPKLKFLQRFDQNVEYKRRADSYPLRDFYRICRIRSTFEDALAFKISLDLLKGLWSYGRFKFTGSGYPQIFSTPQRRNYASDLKSFRGARTCLMSSIAMPSLVGLGFHPPPGAQKR